jgi:hypothetical protein
MTNCSSFQDEAARTDQKQCQLLPIHQKSLDHGDGKMTQRKRRHDSLRSLLPCSTTLCTIVATAWTPFPQPSGLSRNKILDLAQKRFPTGESNVPMKDKVAVITGAARGIGKELCKVCHDLGATVVAMDRNLEGLSELEKALSDEESGNRVWTLPTHHEDLASVAHSADKILKRYPEVDLLVNNAGFAYPQDWIPGDNRMISAHVTTLPLPSTICPTFSSQKFFADSFQNQRTNRARHFVLSLEGGWQRTGANNGVWPTLGLSVGSFFREPQTSREVLRQHQIGTDLALTVYSRMCIVMCLSDVGSHGNCR